MSSSPSEIDALLSPSIRQAVREFLADRQLRGLSPRSVEWYQLQLGKLLQGLEDTPLPELQLATLRGRLAEMAGSRKPSTMNTYIRSLKALLNWLVEEEFEVGIDPRKLKLMKVPKRLPPAFSPEQIRALLAQPDSSWIGRRDRCLISLLLDTGIRVSECIGIRLQHLDPAGGIVTVIGKGNKERALALSAPMRRELRRWLRVRQEKARRLDWEDSRWLFPSRTGRQLDRHTVRERIQAYGKAAGIEGVRCSPHTARSTFATAFCRAGGSIVHLQICLGQSCLEMARRYAAAVDTDAHEASRRFSPLAQLEE